MVSYGLATLTLSCALANAVVTHPSAFCRATVQPLAFLKQLQQARLAGAGPSWGPARRWEDPVTHSLSVRAFRAAGFCPSPLMLQDMSIVNDLCAPQACLGLRWYPAGGAPTSAGRVSH